jgi:phosphatidylinositol alpha-mannosyltransferase
MSQPLRVVLTCPYSLTLHGGVQLQVLGLAVALRARGVDARVVAPTDGPPPFPGVTSVGPSVRYPSNGSIAPITTSKAAARRTLEALRVLEPDVLHLHEALSPGINHAALVATDIPAVGTFHAALPGRNGWYDALRLPLRKMVDRLDVRTAVSEEAQRNVEVAFGGRCEILPNGVAVPTFADAEPWPSPKPAVCFVGRHERRKGLGVLLAAYQGLDRDVALWVIGEGPETAALRGRDGEGVTWLGPVSEVEKAQRLRGATVACFPSIEGESFGVVLLEAMAAGAPVVASDLTGYRHVARDGREALLVPPDDPTALRAALQRVLDEPERRASMIRAGRARADAFSFDRLAERFLACYERAMARRAPTSVPA